METLEAELVDRDRLIPAATEIAVSMEADVELYRATVTKLSAENATLEAYLENNAAGRNTLSHDLDVRNTRIAELVSGDQPHTAMMSFLEALAERLLLREGSSESSTKEIT